MGNTMVTYVTYFLPPVQVNIYLYLKTSNSGYSGQRPLQEHNANDLEGVRKMIKCTFIFFPPLPIVLTCIFYFIKLAQLVFKDLQM